MTTHSPIAPAVFDAQRVALFGWRCPHTEACRAQARRRYAGLDDLVALFDRPQCSETDPAHAEACADGLGLREGA